MSKVTGVVLIIAGVGVAAYQLSAGYEKGPKATQDTEVAQSPSMGAITLAAMDEPQRIEPAAHKPHAATQPEAHAARPLPPPPRAAQPSQPWPPFITHVQRESEPLRLAQAVPQMQRPVVAPTDRPSLARELQRELTRVGCYGGEINSTWTMSTKRAMKAFMDRVNATLPIEEPDQVLLALVKSHPDGVCGKPCPHGQGLSDAGRCVPNAILARTKGSARVSAGSAPKGKTPEPPSWATTATVAAPVPPEPAPEGRMGLAGPHAQGSAPAPAAPMSSDGVSVLPAPPPPPTGGYEPRRVPRQVQGGGSSWARNFYKRRDSGL